MSDNDESNSYTEFENKADAESYLEKKRKEAEGELKRVHSDADDALERARKEVKKKINDIGKS